MYTLSGSQDAYESSFSEQKKISFKHDQQSKNQRSKQTNDMNALQSSVLSTRLNIVFAEISQLKASLQDTRENLED